MDTNSESEKALVMNRREALKRTGLLFGATALSASSISGALHAQSQAAAPGSSLKNFSAVEADTLRAVVDRILPKTDTPGALDVGVPEYIDVMYGEYMTPEEKALGFPRSTLATPPATGCSTRRSSTRCLRSMRSRSFRSGV